MLGVEHQIIDIEREPGPRRPRPLDDITQLGTPAETPDDQKIDDADAIGEGFAAGRLAVFQGRLMDADDRTERAQSIGEAGDAIGMARGIGLTREEGNARRRRGRPGRLRLPRLWQCRARVPHRMDGAILGAAEALVMLERIDVGRNHVGVQGVIIERRKFRPGIIAEKGALADVMLHRITPRRRDLGIAGEIPGAVKQRARRERGNFLLVATPEQAGQAAALPGMAKGRAIAALHHPQALAETGESEQFRLISAEGRGFAFGLEGSCRKTRDLGLQPFDARGDRCDHRVIARCRGARLRGLGAACVGGRDIREQE